MIGITIVGGGTASALEIESKVFPDPSEPEWLSGWWKRHELTASPYAGWVFTGWEIRRHTVWWYNGIRHEETVDEQYPPAFNPLQLEEEDRIRRGGTSEDPTSEDWLIGYVSIKAIFRQASIRFTLTVEPSEASSAGCDANFDENDGKELVKAGIPGDMVTVDVTASVADGWRFYRWRSDLGGFPGVHKKSASQDYQLPLDYRDDECGIVALFKRSDGMPLCSSPSDKRHLVGYSAATGGIICNC